MFEGVAADETAGGIDPRVKDFEEFCQDVESRDDGEVGTAGVARGKEEKKKREGEDGAKLDGGVETKIAAAMKLTDVPLDGACCADEE